MVHVLLIGPPCSGKSTVGRYVAEELGMDYISSGDIARELAMLDQVTAVELMQGRLAPEEQMRAQILSRMNYAQLHGACGVILDGFPRFNGQYTWLMRNIKPPSTVVKIFMNISPSAIIERASKRGRNDDALSAVAERMAFYYKSTDSMVRHMKDLHIVDAQHCSIEMEKTIVLEMVRKLI